MSSWNQIWQTCLHNKCYLYLPLRKQQQTTYAKLPSKSQTIIKSCMCLQCTTGHTKCNSTSSLCVSLQCPTGHTFNSYKRSLCERACNVLQATQHLTFTSSLCVHTSTHNQWHTSYRTLPHVSTYVFPQPLTYSRLHIRGRLPRTLTAILDVTLKTEASDRQENEKMMTDDLENRQNLRQETLEHGRKRNLPVTF